MESWVKENIIYKSLAGSHLFGTNIESSDLDFFSITVDPSSYIFGIKKFDGVFESSGGNSRNTKDDVDNTIKGLRSFVQLCIKGNPSIISHLFVPEDQLIIRHPLVSNLYGLRELVIHKGTALQFLGYLTAQKNMFLSSNKPNGSYRTDLIEQYGYDTKFAYHAIRLGIQALELICDKRIYIPCRLSVREFLLSVREGKFSFFDVSQIISEFSSLLELEISRLPSKADLDAVSNIVEGIYRSYWGW